MTKSHTSVGLQSPLSKLRLLYLKLVKPQALIGQNLISYIVKALPQISKEEQTHHDGVFERRTVIWAGRGRPVPVPPQLLQAILPDPEHVRHPTSPSDHREQKQETRPVPLQLGHLGNEPPAMGLFWSITDLTKAAPANTLSPVANCVNTIGPIIYRLMKKKEEIFKER
ncbi:hypothetical protein G4B88_006168 [Cannabis sativa]|uniref:Uncharacterized protein n=1 Tax=Cannabis sativa TaxID=3483 RepID=A0A7J6IB08_CANSA|nr:hypothetical protein G4B88_006168 [Cannabis sativa]